jgi:hypothetical protein
MLGARAKMSEATDEGSSRAKGVHDREPCLQIVSEIDLEGQAGVLEATV